MQERRCGIRLSRVLAPLSTQYIPYVDRLEPGWFVLDVMRVKAREPKWVALMIDVDPDELKNCVCDVPALLYVRPVDHLPGDRTARQRWFRIPGRHLSKEIARDVLQDMMAAEALGPPLEKPGERPRASRKFIVQWLGGSKSMCAVHSSQVGTNLCSLG
jgi:hypothetical protein